MNTGKSCPLPLCNLIGNFRIYLHIVSLVVILSNWVCDNWVYRLPIQIEIPGDRTMEMNGGSTASYLARTPRVPLFMFILIGLEAKGLLDFQGRRGITSQGSKVSPHHRGRRETHFLVRTSMIFGADVHDPKGCRKTLYKKSLR